MGIGRSGTGDASLDRRKVELSPTLAHTGDHANALTIHDANGNEPSPGVRMTYRGRGLAEKTDPQNLPVDAYHSAWYSVPEHVTFSSSSIFQ